MSTTRTTPPLLTITYFEFRGRVEPSRLTCVIGGIPFSNAVVPSEEFADRKKDLPLQQLPLLFVDQEGKERVIVGQSDAILRYVGKLAGLYPTDPVEAMKVDHWMDVIGDWTKYIMLTYGGAKDNCISDTEWTEAERMAIGKRAIDTKLPKYLGAIDTEIATNGGKFVLGNTLTIADMKLMHWIPWIQSGGLPAFPPSCLTPYPHVLALVETISSLPVVKAFYQNHPVPYEDFEYVVPPSAADAAGTIVDRWADEEGDETIVPEEDVMALVDRISALPAAKAVPKLQNPYHDSATTTDDWHVEDDLAVLPVAAAKTNPKTNPYDDIGSCISAITTDEDNWQVEDGVTEDNDDEEEDGEEEEHWQVDESVAEENDVEIEEVRRKSIMEKTSSVREMV